MAQTAYALHFSEGTPIRKIVSTEMDETGSLLRVTSFDCDFTWQPIMNTAREHKKLVPRKRFWKPDFEKAFHRKLRRDLSTTYNWRFEVYDPLSDTV